MICLSRVSAKNDCGYFPKPAAAETEATRASHFGNHHTWTCTVTVDMIDGTGFGKSPQIQILKILMFLGTASANFESLRVFRTSFG